eukprot:TRINITY_DN18991_c0_g1_i1.p1 TRINITY_DN18991_c0_g1~~TRINITY_DN18991_c0_g1_i1.p1  ORF type:complete len:344 (-),score=99.27 TRINITY_DN18991_c0_g1_i1:771-1802(-)
MAENKRDRLPARSTRGQRVTHLVEDDLEADEEFWNQEAFQEAAEDNEYETEGDEADEFDSDFSDAEDVDEPEEGAEDAALAKGAKKKRKLPPGSKKGGPKKRGRPLGSGRRPTNLEEDARRAAEGRSGSPRAVDEAGEQPAGGAERAEREEAGDDEEGEQEEDAEEDHVAQQQERRQSSRTAVVVKAMEREQQAIRAAAQAPRAAKRKRGPEEERRWTQEEMLLEAAQTEIQNRRSLEILLAREAEVKRKATLEVKAGYQGPLVRFLSSSRTGHHVLDFTQVKAFPEVINARAPPYPPRAECAVTGLPARYFDPVTKLPYATKLAFRTIRDRTLRFTTGDWST